ncbi:unnamed protein product [Protopolystoma xenopodis]|uniref:Uncharacterized protein n=1 Tax=Protopolystoma xenopodis TaxID=117903 RepID=A0A448WHZ4_9PLAT|nr:unnamed protein product [Protopolystoma xenopodis]
MTTRRHIGGKASKCHASASHDRQHYRIAQSRILRTSVSIKDSSEDSSNSTGSRGSSTNTTTTDGGSNNLSGFSGADGETGTLDGRVTSEISFKKRSRSLLGSRSDKLQFTINSEMLNKHSQSCHQQHPQLQIDSSSSRSQKMSRLPDCRDGDNHAQPNENGVLRDNHSSAHRRDHSNLDLVAQSQNPNQQHKYFKKESGKELGVNRGEKKSLRTSEKRGISDKNEDSCRNSEHKSLLPEYHLNGSEIKRRKNEVNNEDDKQVIVL